MVSPGVFVDTHRQNQRGKNRHHSIADPACEVEETTVEGSAIHASPRALIYASVLAQTNHGHKDGEEHSSYREMNRDREKEQQRQTTDRKMQPCRSSSRVLMACSPLPDRIQRKAYKNVVFLKSQSGMKSGVRSDISAFTSTHEVTRGYERLVSTISCAAEFQPPISNMLLSAS
jgi:hypothetical protein